jgi:hypothetical protein
MVFNSSFSNISFKLWWSVLLMEETGVHRENHRPAASHWQILSHNLLSSAPCHEQDLNSQLQWWYALIAYVVVNRTTIRSLRQPLICMCIKNQSKSEYLLYDSILFVNVWVIHIFFYDCMSDFGFRVNKSIHILDLFIVNFTAAMLVGWRDHWIHTVMIIH